MTRIGQEVSERLDIVPAEFFVHRHIYGKWACRCCQVLRQAPSVAEVIEGGIAASGFVAHTLISRFVDHMPYYRQTTINARSGVHTALHAGVHHRPGRRGAAAAARGAQALHPQLCGAARR
ncbi:IS66 family transposase zinc-finger binding domain-containing protein [Variovorax paradoxus]|uniref:IS66 family transposase zinc-finger binding domain-containing protein n=1 Tax=Variovorax paradoxus TaxID=34073 RepID=UPI001F30B791|nr:IS66 family transposase zinc-finger binding domain-containing protein [Variovorax paradoxus]UKI08713.1 IS66 family transposase zinc-finger binding domain-containing protein [Variovorax paradoxus]